MITTDQVQTVRGGHAIDSNGEKIGSIGEVYLDDRTGNPAWVTVNTGLFGTSESFIPLQDASVDGKDVRVPYTKEKVKDAPRVDAEQHLDVEQEKELYRYYGVAYGGSDGQAGTTDGLQDNADAPTQTISTTDLASGRTDSVSGVSDNAAGTTTADAAGAAGVVGAGTAAAGVTGRGERSEARADAARADVARADARAADSRADAAGAADAARAADRTTPDRTTPDRIPSDRTAADAGRAAMGLGDTARAGTGLGDTARAASGRAGDAAARESELSTNRAGFDPGPGRAAQSSYEPTTARIGEGAAEGDRAAAGQDDAAKGTAGAPATQASDLTSDAARQTTGVGAPAGAPATTGAAGQARAGADQATGDQAGDDKSALAGQQTKVGARDPRDLDGDGVVTRYEERLAVATERREVGRVRLRKSIITENQTVTVPLTREEVTLERFAIDAPELVDGDPFGDDVREFVLYEDVPVVSKQAVAVERIGLRKNTVQENREVTDTIRKEKIDLDGDGIPDALQASFKKDAGGTTGN